MPRTIISVNELQEYLIGAAERANHHAQNINRVILALAGAVILFKDQGEDIRVKTYRGNLANVLWVTINGVRYALSYNHTEESVEIRRHSLQGEVVGSFDNDDNPREIIDTFTRLSSAPL